MQINLNRYPSLNFASVETPAEYLDAKFWTQFKLGRNLSGFTFISYRISIGRYTVYRTQVNRSIGKTIPKVEDFFFHKKVLEHKPGSLSPKWYQKQTPNRVTDSECREKKLHKFYLCTIPNRKHL